MLEMASGKEYMVRFADREIWLFICASPSTITTPPENILYY